MIQQTNTITFPQFSGIRCLMMPYVQGDPDSVPNEYAPYRDIIAQNYLKAGDIGFLTIDESVAVAGTPHRGARAKFGRALHTEAGYDQHLYCWGSGGSSWGGKKNVVVDRDVRILIANSLDDSCAVWDAEQEDTSLDGDIGYLSRKYPYENAVLLKAGEVFSIGVLTPHESLPVKTNTERQFLRIVSSGVWGREPYFTENPLVN
jgi:hypothetical protein